MFLALCKQSHCKCLFPVLIRGFCRSREICFPIELPRSHADTPSSSEVNDAPEESSSLNFSRVSEFVISQRSHLWHTGNGFGSLSLEDYLLELSSVAPDTLRKFYRASLKPQDVLQILLIFESHGKNHELQARKVESLWGIFEWATENIAEFEHFPRSCRIMGSLLAKSGFHNEAEILLSRNERRKVFMDCPVVFSDLIDGYLEEFKFDKAISVYEKMRSIKLVPRISCYKALLGFLIELNETEVLYNVYTDLIHLNMDTSFVTRDTVIHENVIRLLCLSGKVQEARELSRIAIKYGCTPSNIVINSMTCGYCDKKDYDDLLSFFVEAKVSPDVLAGNKILYSVCQNFGVDQADVFLQKLEDLDFCPDAITLGILISFSCREGKLRKAFFYVSDILARGLKPRVHSYNALLSGIFKEGMWMHSRDILAEMNDTGVPPDLSTFRVMLAGLCGARRFDELKAIVHEMSELNLIELSPQEDALTKGLMILGCNPFTVKIKRDNGNESFRTEFFDSLGNGLYLETNVDEFDRIITEVLDDCILPKLNPYVVDDFDVHDANNIPAIVEETVRWGQEMSLPAYSSFLGYLCRRKFSICIINHYLGTIFKSIYDLHQSTLNMLVRTYSIEGLSFKARTLVDGMVRKGCMIDDKTFSVLFYDICRNGDRQSFHYFQELAKKYNWSPEVGKLPAIITCMCKNKWFREALELFGEAVFVSRVDLWDTLNPLVKELSCQGFTSTALLLLQELPCHVTDCWNEAYNSVLSGFCLENRFDEAFRILDHMLLCPGLSPCVDAVAQLVHQLCRIKNYEKALQLKNAISRDQYSPSALHIHYALMKGFCKYGKVDEAAFLLHQIFPMGFSPDQDVFNALIVGYSDVDNFLKAKEVLGFMIKKNLDFLISSYSHLVRLICAQGKISLCLSFKQLMLQATDFPDLVLYNILIFHVSSTRNRYLLDSVIDSFLREGLQFDAVTFKFLIHGFLLCNDVPESLKHLKSMMKHDLLPSNRSLREVILGLCRIGELDLALSLSQEMESRGWVHGSVIQIAIVKALTLNGMLDEAVEFLDRLAVADLIPSDISYDHLIKHLCVHGKLDKAVGLLNVMLMKERSPEASSYDYIIQRLCQGGGGFQELDRALDLHAEMLCRKLKPSVDTWGAIIRSLCESERIEEAEKLLKSMIQVCSPPSPPREIFYCLISKCRALNKSDKAYQVLKWMQQAGHTPDFDTHWPLVSNLSSSSKTNSGNRGFLSSLVSGFGFTSQRPS